MIQMKKKTVSFCWGCLLFMLGSIVYLQAQDTARKIGNNPLTIEQTAVLELESTTKGFLLPRMTTAERDAITSPANGLMIFNTSSQSVDFYDAPTTSWKNLQMGVNVVPFLKSSFTTPYNFRVTITNLSTVDIMPTFSTSDVSISGLTSATSTAVDDTSQTIPPFGSHTVNFTISYGSATAAAPLAIQGVYSYANQTTNSTTNVGSNTVLLHNGLFYDEVSGQNNTIWLDRNLGATRVATASNDTAAFGDYYQWGRGTDGHQRSNSGVTTTIATNSTPGHGAFIRSNDNWLNTTDNTLWQGVNGTNNPCPSGYRVPTETELNAEGLAFSSQNIAGAFASPLKLPATGLRTNTNGVVSHNGAGYYWTSTIDNTNARLFHFFNTAPMASLVRAFGFSVRCIKN